MAAALPDSLYGNEISQQNTCRTRLEKKSCYCAIRIGKNQQGRVEQKETKSHPGDFVMDCCRIFETLVDGSGDIKGFAVDDHLGQPGQPPSRAMKCRLLAPPGPTGLAQTMLLNVSVRCCAARPPSGSQLFQRINRACSGVTFDRMANGLIQFTDQFPGQVWLEILLLAGLTDTPAALTRIAEWATRIKPARVQLNTVCRPPAEKYARPVSNEQMQALSLFFAGPVEIIGKIPAQQAPSTTIHTLGDSEIMAMLNRRPCTAEDIAAGLRLHLGLAQK